MSEKKRESSQALSGKPMPVPYLCGNKYRCFALSILRQDKENNTKELSNLNFFQCTRDLGEVYAVSDV